MNEDERNAYKATLRELRDKLATFERALDDDPDGDALIRHIAGMRALLNAMFARATNERMPETPGDGPGWKSAAADMTG